VTRDWYIAAPVMLCAVLLMQVLTYRRRRPGMAAAYGAALVFHACFGFEMHHGGRSWHGLILGPCSRTEYHRR